MSVAEGAEEGGFDLTSVARLLLGGRREPIAGPQMEVAVARGRVFLAELLFANVFSLGDAGLLVQLDLLFWSRPV